MTWSVNMHHRRFGRMHGAIREVAAHPAQLLRGVTVAGKFLPALFPLVRGGPGGLGGFVFWELDVTRSHGKYLAAGRTTEPRVAREFLPLLRRGGEGRGEGELPAVRQIVAQPLTLPSPLPKG